MTLTVLSIFAAVIAIFCALVYRKVNKMVKRMGLLEAKIGVEIKPAWQYVLKVAAAELTHPHKRFEEADALIVEALLEPEVPMRPERLKLLNEKLDERAEDTSEDMRPGEQSAAVIFKHALTMVRLEGECSTALSDITMVGSQQPERQESEEGETEESEKPGKD